MRELIERDSTGLQMVAGTCRRTYRYDPENAITQVVDSLRGQSTYEYDANERLVRSVHSQLG